jgi:hypothetical protein
MTHFTNGVLGSIDAELAAWRAAAAGGVNGVGADFPWASQGTYWFSSESIPNINIPYHDDGSVNMSALETEIFNILSSAANKDQMNINTEMGAAGLLMNIGNIWGSLSPAEQGQIQQFLNLQVGGNSILNIVSDDSIQTIVEGYFYKNAASDPNIKADTIAFAQKLLTTLQGFGNCPITNELTAQAMTYCNAANLTDWMNDNSTTANGVVTPNENYYTFAFMQGIKWSVDFSMNSQVGQFFNGWRHLQNVNMDQQFAGNVEALYINAIMLLYSMTDVDNQQIAGRGSLMNAMTNGPGADLQAESAQFQAGNFNAASAQAFYQSVYDAQVDFSDPRFGSISAQEAAAYNDFYNPSTANGGKSVTDPVTGQQTTLGQIYQNIQNGVAGYSWGTMATALNSIEPGTPSTSNPNPISPTDTAIAGDISQGIATLGNASQAQGTQVQSIESDLEKLIALLSSALKMFTDQNKSIVQSTGSAS